MVRQPDHPRAAVGIPFAPHDRSGTQGSDYTVHGSRGRVPTFLVFFLAFLLSAAYMFSYSKRGWLPEDDGTLAQSALRVLQGQLPHRDFAEPYTGGLSYFHALGFRLFGVNLVALRKMIFIVFLTWLPAVFYVASRFLSPIPAAATTARAALWALPNYPTPMPSWYNLFLAVYGAAALLRYLETGSRRWLFLAGLCGGLSLLVKIIGLYYVAAVLIFFVFREQWLNRVEATRRPQPAYVYRVFSIAGLVVFLAAILVMMGHRFDDREFTQFFLPSATLVALLVWREFLIPARAGSTARFSTLFRLAAPFGVGLALPVAIFLVPYATAGSLRALTHDVFGLSITGLQAMGLLRPQHAQNLVFPIAFVAVVVAGTFWRRFAGAALAICSSIACLLLLFASTHNAKVTEAIWFSAALSTPVVTTLGVVLVLNRRCSDDSMSGLRENQIVLLLALAAVCSLVQFPFAAPIYFCYFAPLLVLAAAAVISMAKRVVNPQLLACLLVFYALFAVVRIGPGAIYDNDGFKVSPVLKTLNLRRAGDLSVELSEMYEDVVTVVLQHAGTGPVIATPECPDVYFLSGLRNPTNNDGGLAPNEMLHAIQNKDVRVVVINTGSVFSRSTLTQEVVSALDLNFPHGVQVGKYWVSWR